MDEHLIRRMCDVLTHRGPDESGTYVTQNIGLGHRRLSIIDLTTGQQPMCNSRQDLWITFNGEIYNFPDLRKNLQKRGYPFHSNSDTEVIIHLYDEYDTSCVNYLRGMFAFAIWDATRQRLFLARDRVGQKPLFYTTTNDALVFASEIKALLQDPGGQRSLNLTALYHYLTYQYVPPPDTIFQGIYKLPPAHILVCEQGKITIERYWDLQYVPKHQMDEPEIIERLKELLQESVKIRMISDVPIGAFLSGGVDSSLVVGIMAQYASQPVNTFSIGFQEKEFNELPYARFVAERFGTNHQELIVEPDAIEILPKLIWHFDEPFGDSSAIPTYYVSKMTSQYVKVALNGDGGDESFAGYLRYLGLKFVRYYRILPESVRRALLSPLLRRLKVDRGCRIPRGIPLELIKPLRYLKYLNALSLETQEELYARTLTIFKNSHKLELLTHEARHQLSDMDSLDYMFQYFHADNAEHITDKMLYTDVKTYLPGDLLVKIDRMTMAHSLEGRSPFLDHKLIEFVAALPPQYKLRGTQLKVVLKKLGETWLPRKFMVRRKQGFGVPVGQWFRHELREMVHDTLSSSYLSQEGIFNHTSIQKILQEHQHGEVNHSHRIWVLLNLELWYRMFIRHA